MLGAKHAGLGALRCTDIGSTRWAGQWAYVSVAHNTLLQAMMVYKGDLRQRGQVDTTVHRTESVTVKCASNMALQGLSY
jgi:hypothetical protein